jgi:hypothetical protein
MHLILNLRGRRCRRKFIQVLRFMEAAPKEVVAEAVRRHAPP